VDLLRPDQLEGHARDRQAPLVVRPLAPRLRDHGVDHDLRALADVVHEQALLHADLRGGQAEAGGLVHRGEHVLGQLHELGVDIGDLGGALAQHRVADLPDLVGRGHPCKVIGHGRFPTMAESGGHYFEPDPVAPARPMVVRLDLPDRSLDLRTDSGVFAATAVDAATKYLLLEAPAPPAAGTFVDLGCGYGPIALTLAARAPGAEVWAIDVNRRALELCRANAAKEDLANVRTAEPDDVPADLAVDLLWSNPPIRVGKEALHELLRGWLDRLTPTGSAVLVVHKHLGADSLHRWLEAQGWPTTRLGSRQGSRLLEVRPR
jgi:16S rRNA (guanine1207-N2)-methyltransferase